MARLIDKLLVLGLCLLMLSFSQIRMVLIIALLIAVAVSSLSEYFDNSVPPFLCAGFVVLCLFAPWFTAFLPLVVYDCAGFDKWYLRFFWVAALPACFFMSGLRSVAAITLLSGASFLLHYRAAGQLEAREELFLLADSTKERSMSLERRNRELMDKQDYEVRLAMLKERNRIAREIHDNVGHLLTRSILQIGALLVTHSDGGEVQDELRIIKDTMSDAMDSVRNSVHDLHDDSVDLKMQLETVVGGFGFCPVSLHYDAGELPGAVKFCFIAVAREALSNVANHSDARKVVITVMEHPAFCRLSIEDDGTIKWEGVPGGIGLRSMADRVEALGGVFRTEYDNGFKIFITVPIKTGDRG